MEIIINNDGTTVVEINGRFYAHTCYMGGIFYMRQIDVDSPVPNMKAYAYPSDNGLGEQTGIFDPSFMTPIPNPALSWPVGTRVLVRNSNSIRWVERIFRSIDEGDILCEDPKRNTLVECWEQCKLAEGA